MNKQQLEQHHKSICSEALSIALRRGVEYSHEDDELRTFRDAGQLFGCKPSDVARMQLCLKVARMRELKMDTVYDMINYAIYMILLANEEIK